MSDSSDELDYDRPEDPTFLLFPHQDPKRWPNITQALANPITSVKDFIVALKAISPRSPVSFFKDYLKYADAPGDGSCSNQQFVEKVIPTLQRLVLETPKLFPIETCQSILLTQQVDRTVTITREQAACILANGFMCTFGRRPSSFPEINFELLYATSDSQNATAAAVKCILNYFLRISDKMPTGNLIVHRKVLKDIPNHDFWRNADVPLCNVEVFEKGTIEDDAEAAFHADFANKFLGGGVLHGGCAQEEMLFVYKPECLAAQLFCEVMLPHESIIITGAERFSTYKGYGYSFRYAGNFVDTTPTVESLNALRNHIVAVDAVVNYGNVERQPKALLRDVNKLLAGLINATAETSSAADTAAPRQIFSTGHWGCGAFGGDKHLKAIQQLVAASVAGVDLHYYAFGDRSFSVWFPRVYALLKKRNLDAGSVFKLLEEVPKDCGIFAYLEEKLQPEEDEDEPKEEGAPAHPKEEAQSATAEPKPE